MGGVDHIQLLSADNKVDGIRWRSCPVLGFGLFLFQLHGGIPSLASMQACDGMCNATCLQHLGDGVCGDTSSCWRKGKNTQEEGSARHGESAGLVRFASPLSCHYCVAATECRQTALDQIRDGINSSCPCVTTPLDKQGAFLRVHT